jgi:3-oxoacyl-(acyl-carrier-protein) synthase
MDTVIGDCKSTSSGEDERMQRRLRFAIRTVMSAVAEAGISDNSYALRCSGSVPGRAPKRDCKLLQGRDRRRYGLPQES